MKISMVPALLAVLGVQGCCTPRSSDCTWHPGVVAVGLSVPEIRGVCDDEEKAKMRLALALLARVLDDAKFADEVRKGPELEKVRTASAAAGIDRNQGLRPLSVGHTYAWIKLEGPADSNEDVLASIKVALVEFQVRINHRVAPWCGFPWVNEIGHREAPNWIVTQQCHIEDMTAAELAGHWLHEYMHIAGYDHAYKDDELRPFSVPYFVGDLATRWATELERIERAQ